MRRGFTLIELVIVIVILGILAAVAIPKYYDLTTQAEQSAEMGVVGGVRAGIATYYAHEVATGTAPASAWPSSLDSNPGAPTVCDATNPCFDDILSQGGITDGNWSKDSSGANDVYTGPTGATYTYDSSDGSFE